MRALILGITGQDGAYLARLLLARGVEVWGTTRDLAVAQLGGLQTLGIDQSVTLRALDATSPAAVAHLFEECAPDRVFNMGGQSSVGQSFIDPAGTIASIATVTATLLEAVRTVRPGLRFYNAGSSESFGDTGGAATTPDMALRPLSPYGVAKAAAAMLVKGYRESYGLFVVTGHLFNHESRLRPQRFVTAKIISAAARIAAGSGERLRLGDLGIARDWGWAPEYVDAMARMLEQDEPTDQVVATGTSLTLEAFVWHSFDYFGLDWGQHVESDPALMRPNELRVSRGDPSGAAATLGWRAQTHGRELIDVLCADARG